MKDWNVLITPTGNFSLSIDYLVIGRETVLAIIPPVSDRAAPADLRSGVEEPRLGLRDTDGGVPSMTNT